MNLCDVEPLLQKLEEQINSFITEKELINRKIVTFKENISIIDYSIQALENAIKVLKPKEEVPYEGKRMPEQPFFRDKDGERADAIVKFMQKEGEKNISVTNIGKVLGLKRETILAWMTRRVRENGCPWTFGKNSSNFSLK